MKPYQLRLTIRCVLLALLCWWLYGRVMVERLQFYRFDSIAWTNADKNQRYYMAKFLIDQNLLIGKTRPEVIKLLGKPDVNGGLMLYNLGLERGSFFKIDDDWLDIQFGGVTEPRVVARVGIRPD
jgi:hypothetical protein